MANWKPDLVLLGLAVLLFARPTLAFGAGNIASISKVEGQNWRHGDIEDTLLKIFMARAVGGKKFNKMNVARVYFGNWLRDYSQAIDVGTVKSVSAEAIRLLLCVLGFMTFGYGSREFEVTAERLGCYQCTDHIDNPKDYADNIDARQYDRRLRGPVDERVELAVDPETGLKNYIANERVNIATSALHVRRVLGKCIDLGRSYQRSRDKAEFYEALRLLGTGLHCLEDFLAHSNYVELALRELGEDVFCHVGRRTMMRLPGARNEVYPCVTGTFGGVDFLHSVTGEVSDKLTQNEIQELEGTLQQSQGQDTSMLAELLDKIPDGLMGGNKKQKMNDIKTNAAAAQMENMNISPKEPEEMTRQAQRIFRQIMPAIEFHDELLQSISEAVDKIPVLPKIIEQLEEQLSIYVFSIIAPFVVPLIRQVKSELATGSSEIIHSSENEQMVVFNDHTSSNPTHSMLSKDHFSNILNEIAGRTASKMLTWVVPQIMNAWDNHNEDVDRLMSRLISGVMHHPAQRDMGDDGARDGRQLMFKSVEEWWRDMDEHQRSDYRRKLSREGVQQGQNHKEGVHDSGHGCGKPLGMHKNFGTGGGTLEDKIAGAAAGAIMGGLTGGISKLVEGQTGYKLPDMSQKQQAFGGSGGHGHESSESGGGLGGLIGAVTGGLLGGFGADKTDTFQSSGRSADGGYTQTTTQYGRDGDRYAQAEYSDTRYSDGRERTEYRRYDQDEGGRGEDRRYEETIERRPAHAGAYEERTESRYEDGRVGYREETTRYDGGGQGYGRQEQGRREDYGRQEYAGGGQDEYGGGRQDYGRQDYGRQEYARQDQGRREDYGRQEYAGGGQDEYGGGRQDYERQEQGRREDYGRQEYAYSGGRQDEYRGGREEYGRQEYGGSREEDGGDGEQYDSGLDDQYGGGGGQEYGHQEEYSRY